MSNFKSVTKIKPDGLGSVAYFNPGGPTDAIHTEWPFDWICVPDVTVATDWFVPFYVTQAQAAEYYRRFKRLKPNFSLTGAGYTFARNPILERKIGASVVSDELELEKPGIRADDIYLTPRPGPFVFEGEENNDGWNGPGSTSLFQFRVEAFMKQRVTVNGDEVDIPHMIFQTDGAFIMPSFRITGSLVVTTPGSEYAWFFTTEDINTPVYVDSLGLFPTKGGSSVTLNFSSATVNPDAFTCNVNPFEWYSYGGKWNIATGARN